jgi:hypothetical protein
MYGVSGAVLAASPPACGGRPGRFPKEPQLSRPRILAIVFIVADHRDPPSSTFPAAPAIETTGEAVEETARPLAKVLSFPRQRALRLVGGAR